MATVPWPLVATRVRGYVALTKPRIVELLLVTTVPTMVVAQGRIPSGWLVLATVAGGTLAAGGANAINMYLDRDIDRMMMRTANRPLVRGTISSGGALVFALVLETVAFAVLWLGANLLSALLAVSATAFYVFIYTIWLKRTSTQNIVIGGAAGAVPVLVGWAAVTGHLGLAPLVLFALVFFWTPPHFWALAVRYREDYAAARVPMLPAVASIESTARQILGYTVMLWITSMLLVPVARLGVLYTATAVILGIAFIVRALQLVREPTSRNAMRLFGFSITYLALLFTSMAADVLLIGH